MERISDCIASEGHGKVDVNIPHYNFVRSCLNDCHYFDFIS